MITNIVSWRMIHRNTWTKKLVAVRLIKSKFYVFAKNIESLQATATLLSTGQVGNTFETQNGASATGSIGTPIVVINEQIIL